MSAAHPFRRVCVYCGSATGARASYAAAADATAAALAERGIGLVYGAARIGVMGALADALLARGGRVIGVIPRALVEKEVAHAGLTELHITASMHERKAMMADLSDAFVALPGGLGTLDELFEIWTWAQLGLHRKPVGLLDVEGYFDGLVRFLDHAVAEGFVRPKHRAMLVVDRDPSRLLDRLAAVPPPEGARWIGPQDV
jgi:uncharacterized protein (TIGR00730 family)